MPPESPTPGGASGEEWTERTATLRTAGSPKPDAWPLLPGTRTSRGSPSRLADRFRGARGGRSSPPTGGVMLLKHRMCAGTGWSAALRALWGHGPVGPLGLRGGLAARGRRGGGGQPRARLDPAVAGRLRLGAGPEGRVDVDQHLLLALAQVRLALDGVHQACLLGPLVADVPADVADLPSRVELVEAFRHGGASPLVASSPVSGNGRQTWRAPASVRAALQGCFRCSTVKLAEQFPRAGLSPAPARPWRGGPRRPAPRHRGPRSRPRAAPPRARARSASRGPGPRRAARRRGHGGSRRAP